MVPAKPPKQGLYRILMNGVSHMIPFVVVGGLLIAIAYGIGGTPTPGGLVIPEGSFYETLAGLGGLGFTLMVPILSGYIAYAIADRPGLAPGMITGLLATTPALYNSEAGAGFIGGIVTGLLSGVVALGIKKIPVNKYVAPIWPIIVIPVGATLISGLTFIYALGAPIAAIFQSLTVWLEGMQGAVGAGDAAERLHLGLREQLGVLLRREQELAPRQYVILGGRERVVVEQLVSDRWVEPGDVRRDPGDVVLAVGDAGNQRRAHRHVGAALAGQERRQVGEDAVVRCADVATVGVVVDQLAVGEHVVGVGEGLREELGAHVQRGLDSCVHARLLQRLQQGGGEVRQEQGLAAGQRDAAALAEEHTVALGDADQLRDGIAPRVESDRAGGAERGEVLPVRVLDGGVDEGLACRVLPRLATGCRPYADAAVDAPRTEEDRVTAGVYGLRVLAPCAFERAALEEDGGPDAVAVVRGEAADVDHVGRHPRVFR